MASAGSGGQSSSSAQPTVSVTAPAESATTYYGPNGQVLSKGGEAPIEGDRFASLTDLCSETPTLASTAAGTGLAPVEGDRFASVTDLPSAPQPRAAQAVWVPTEPPKFIVAAGKLIANPDPNVRAAPRP